MPVVPGTKVSATFFTFGSTPPPKPGDPMQYPDLYYGAGEGTLTMASVNAGNSESLAVGLGGVNRQFADDLGTGPGGAGQKHVNSGTDNYETRHNNLLAQVGSDGTASQSYASDDPCAFSWMLASLVNTKTGWQEGVCFVDVFSSQLCPAGNTLNAAMVYAAPPNGDNYASEADFLAAIEATAVNIIRAVAGYNAMAKKQNLPVIETLRNTLFSSGIYNRSNPRVDPDKIARAIVAGFQSELQAQDAGLVELQFPVGRGAQGLLFGPVEDDLTQAAGLGGAQGAWANPGRAPMPGGKQGGKGSKPARKDNNNDDDDGRGVPMRSVGDQAGSDKALGQVVVDAQSGQSGQQKVTRENTQMTAAIASGSPLGNYDVLPANPNKPLTQPNDENYIKADAAWVDGNNPSTPVQGATTAGQAAVAQSDDDVVMTHTSGESKVDRGASRSAGQNDKKGYSTCCKAVSGIVGIGVLGISATLVWAFAFRGAATNAESGAGTGTTGSGTGNLEASDQTVEANDLDSTVDVDLPLLNNLMMIDNISFSQPTFTPPPPQGTGGNWSSTPSIHALFTPDTGEVGAFSSISVQYVLWASIQGIQVQSDFKTLTVNFNPTPPVEVAALANDRTSTVTIDVASHYLNFAGTIQLETTTGGTWSNDPSNAGNILYTPDSTLTGNTATALYVRVTTWGVPSSKPAMITVNLPPASRPQATGTAGFLPNDTTTEGDWLHVYGADGYLIAGDQDSNPTYVTPALSSPTVSTLSSSTNSALVKGSDPTTTIAAAWSATSPLTVDLACSDTTTIHQVALYFADYDPMAGGQTVKVVDANGTSLASQALPATLTGGLYLVCDISGHVKFQISNGAGNAVLSGIFFGGPAVSATFVKSDTATQGSWQTVYGTDGYAIADSPVEESDPSYVTPSFAQVQVYVPTGAESTTDVRALQKAGDPAHRVAGTWYPVASNSSVDLIDLPFSGSALHQVALYFLDWDNAGIAQTVEVLDPSGFVLNTRMLSSFNNGTWLVWKVSGHVQIQITKTQGDQPTLSGVFFDPPPSTTMAFAAFSAAPVAWDFTVWMTDAPESVKVDFLKRCQIPAGFKSIELSGGVSDDVTVPKQGRWRFESTGTPPTADVLFEPEAGLLLNQGYAMKYRVVDQKGTKSNEATMTVDYSPLPLFMPRASNFLSSADPRYGKFAVADVLSGCSASSGIAKGSVRLMGARDILQGNPEPQVYLRDDRKSMCMVGEGIWMVDDNDLIVFQGDPNLSYAPTPARFCFFDNKGYQSNVAEVVFDSSLTDAIAQTPPALSKLTDAEFWQNYAAEVKQSMPPEQFVAIAQTLAVVTRSLGSVGPEPDFDFDSNYTQWDGGSWADLQTLCAKVVASAIDSSAPQLAARYWQLNLMIRMALQAFPPS